MRANTDAEVIFELVVANKLERSIWERFEARMQQMQNEMEKVDLKPPSEFSANTEELLAMHEDLMHS